MVILVRWFVIFFCSETCEMREEEITEACFCELTGNERASILYERHTMHANGCNQICLTVYHDSCWFDDLELA